MSKRWKDALSALRGLLEIASIAMPDSYFQSDSRVIAARKVLDDEQQRRS